MNGFTPYPNTLDQQRQRFEQLLERPQPAKRHPLIQLLMSAGGTIVRFLTDDPQLRIWQRNRHGRSIWFAYDPITGQKRQFFSEYEVRLWLDTRYYE